MRGMVFRRSFLLPLLLVAFLGSIWMGCSSSVKEKREEGVPGEAAGKPNAKYYQFEDVLVPDELSFDASKSFIYETPRFKAGILYFSKWRLEGESLVDFFNYHMEKDNWKMVNSYRGKETVLNFSKPDKSCSIKITVNWLSTTYVEIRVGPIGEKKM